MAKPLKTCGCSADCKATTRGSFAPGHDARMVSMLTQQIKRAEMSLDDALALVYKAGGSEALQTKLTRSVERNVPIEFEWVGETLLVDKSWQFCIHYLPSTSLVESGMDSSLIERNEYMKRPWELSLRHSGLAIGRFETYPEAVDAIYAELKKRENRDFRESFEFEYKRVHNGGRVRFEMRSIWD